MTTPRLNTIYDLSGLRLHRDGTRVQQSSRNLRLQTARTSIRDARGNWVARDAGGSSTIGRIKPVVEESEEEELEEEEFDAAGASSSSPPPPSTMPASGPGNNIQKRYHKPDGRTSKRRKFAHDLDFLETSTPPQQVSSHGVSEQPTSRDFVFPPPSSDLLKSIHHYASVYYTSRNQLSNGSREHRIQRKEKMLRKLEEHNSKQTTPEDDTGSDTNAPADTPTTKRKTQGRIKKTEMLDYPVDMYRVMDGSALMAIGMLLQEHIAHLLGPDGWQGSCGPTDLDPEDIAGSDDGGEDQRR